MLRKCSVLFCAMLSAMQCNAKFLAELTTNCHGDDDGDDNNNDNDDDNDDDDEDDDDEVNRR